jgi:hypothetical protein
VTLHLWRACRRGLDSGRGAGEQAQAQLVFEHADAPACSRKCHVRLLRGLGQAADWLESITQTVSGFTIGNSYTLSWYHGNFGFMWSDDPESASTDIALTFRALPHPQGTSSYQSIDGIRLTDTVVPPANAVPEPAALSLFSGAGLAMLLAGRRRKQAQKAA